MYHRGLYYSYAPGISPAMEALLRAPERVSRVLIHSKLAGEGADQLLQTCEALKIRTETADRLLRRVSGRENCFAAAVFEKMPQKPLPENNHVVLVNPMDAGNLGTILRTALGFEYLDIALILPCADPYDPHVIRASMGAIFSLRVFEYPDFATYRAEFGAHTLYPFMLDASRPLRTAASEAREPFSLIFGNEGSGLPSSFSQTGQAVRIEQGGRVDSLNLAIAAGIGIYAFKLH